MFPFRCLKPASVNPTPLPARAAWRAWQRAETISSCRLMNFDMAQDVRSSSSLNFETKPICAQFTFQL